MGKMKAGDKIKIAYFNRDSLKPYKVEMAEFISYQKNNSREIFTFRTQSERYKTIEAIFIKQGLIKLYKPKTVKEDEVMAELKFTKEQLMTEAIEHGTDSKACQIIGDKYGLKKGTVCFYFSEWGIIKEIKKTLQDLLTRDVLIQECKQEGLTLKAFGIIGKKYSYFKSEIEKLVEDWGIKAELRNEKEEPIEEKENDSEASEPQNENHLQDPEEDKSEKPNIEPFKTITLPDIKIKSKGLRSAYLHGDFADYKIFEEGVSLVDKEDDGCFMDVAIDELVGFALEVLELHSKLMSERNTIKGVGNIVEYIQKTS